MGFWDRIFGGGNSEENDEPSDGESSNGADSRSLGFWANLFGNRSGSESAEEIANRADEFEPEDRSQGLFYLGWVDRDVPPDIRENARRRWEQEYGEWNPRKGRRTLSEENWQRWRRFMGY